VVALTLSVHSLTEVRREEGEIEMRKRSIATLVAVSVFTSLGMTGASADAKANQSMTHIKTVAGLTSLLEGAGVVMYVQGGATAGVIGDSLDAANSQMVFHVPVTATKGGVAHVGSNIVFHNTANNKQVVLRNPLIDLAKGTVSAVIPQAGMDAMVALSITNGSAIKAKVTNDRKAKLRTTVYPGAALSLAPGIAAAIVSLLGLPEGALPDGAAFATADVTIYSKIAGK
jgi:hypothetical protein